MKLSRFFIPTVRQVPSDAEIASHRLMIRAGMIRKIAAGIYDMLPLGLRVIRKVENIVREEMNRAGAVETLLPSLIPAELWKETERWDFYGKELLRFRDRHDNEFCYGPTHEEVMTDLVRREVKSYKQLPLNLYQIQTKFRDEIRPRFGVMRAREFLMKDGYSFDVDEETAGESYRKMFEAYSRIFQRAGLEFRAVEADTGRIGGSSSHEFMVLADSGEDVIVSCPDCGYGSNIEKTEAVSGEKSAPASSDIPAMKEVATPGMGSIEEVSAFLKLKPENFIKTLIYSVDGTEECVAVLVRGDYEISEPKLRNLLSAQDVELAQPEQVKRITGASVGFAGPQRLACKIVADNSIRGITAGVTGANRDDYHATHVVEGRDFKPDIFGDIRLVRQGDPCPACRNAELEFHRGIEVGHIFRLGTKYSKAMKAAYLDRDGKEQVIVMGTYGIGIARIAAAAIEQSHDENGIIWPASIAPFDVIILPLNVRKENVLRTAVEVEKELEEAGLEVLLDDREERAGVKFNDADLIGIPVQVIIGEKGLAGGEVEIKHRKSGTRMKVKRDEAAKKAAEIAGSK